MLRRAAPLRSDQILNKTRQESFCYVYNVEDDLRQCVSIRATSSLVAQGLCGRSGGRNEERPSSWTTISLKANGFLSSSGLVPATYFRSSSHIHALLWPCPCLLPFRSVKFLSFPHLMLNVTLRFFRDYS